MKEAIRRAIEGGWRKDISGRFLEPTNNGVAYCFEDTDKAEGFILAAEIREDALFWQALGKAMGWGQWTKSLSEIEHEWELEHYLPDTGKTPVYMCKKCFARKVLDVITIEVEYEWLEIKPSHYTEREVLRGHGAGVKPTWEQYWHRFIDHLAEGKDADSFFKKLLGLTLDNN